MLLLLSVLLALSFCVSATSKDSHTQIAQLLDEIEALQYPSSCEGRKFIVFQYSIEDEVNGFAAMYHFAMSSLALAHALNRTLIEVFPEPSSIATEGYARQYDPWNRAAPGHCGIHKLGCFFRPLSACALFSAPIQEIPLLDPKAAEDLLLSRSLGVVAEASTLEHFQQQVLRIDKMDRMNKLFLDITRGDYAPNWFRRSLQWRRDYFPAFLTWHYRPHKRILKLTNPLTSQMKVFHKSQAQALDRLLRVGFAEDIAQWFPPLPPVLSIHVRRGDTQHLSWRYQGALESYIYQAEMLRVLHQRKMEAWVTTQKKALESKISSIGEDNLSSNDTISQESLAMLRSEIADLERLFHSRWPIFIATDSDIVRQQARGYFSNHTTYELLEYPVRILSGGDKGENTINVESVIRATNMELTHNRTVQSDLSGIESRFEANKVTFLPSAPLKEAKGNEKSASTATHSTGPRGSRFSSSKPFRPKELVLLGPPDSPKPLRMDIRRVDLDQLQLPAAESLNPLLQDLVSLLDSVVADTWVLAHGDHLIGTCLSQISRIASELMQAAGRQRSIIALDNDMCRRFGRHFYSIMQDWRESWDVFVSQ